RYIAASLTLVCDQNGLGGLLDNAVAKWTQENDKATLVEPIFERIHEAAASSGEECSDCCPLARNVLTEYDPHLCRALLFAWYLRLKFFFCRTDADAAGLPPPNCAFSTRKGKELTTPTNKINEEEELQEHGEQQLEP
ncbi:unnamed protein product, partial [Amoebophrya sp. A25]